MRSVFLSRLLAPLTRKKTQPIRRSRLQVEQLEDRCVPSTTYSSTVLADSPTAYYRLGESSGTTMTDSSSNGNNGTYANIATYTVNGGGSDIWGTSDQFNYDYQTGIAPGAALVAEVNSQTNPNGWAKAGLMIRASTTAGSVFVDVVATPGNGVAIEARPTTGTSGSLYNITHSVPTNGSVTAYPITLKLTWSSTGNVFTGYYSTNGSTYTSIGNITLTNMPSTALGGLAVTSHSNGNLSSATFTNVAFHTLGDAGFESPTSPKMGTGGSAYVYNPTGTAWTFSGGSGVAGNASGFTAGNPNAPEGSQVAFLQQTGSFSQSVNFTQAGTYTLSFDAAQRQNTQASSQTFEVMVDTTVVGTFTPSSINYNLYTTNNFTVTAGSHTIAFIGLNPNGGDNTAFVDAVTLPVQSPILTDLDIGSPSPAGSAVFNGYGAPGAIVNDSNTAISFNGISAYGQMPSTLFNYPTGTTGSTYTSYQASFETWFQTTQSGGVILGQTASIDSSNGNTYPGDPNTPKGYVPAMYVDTNGHLEASMFYHKGSGPGFQIVSPTAVNDGNWHYVVDTYSNGFETLYLDGKEIASQNVGEVPYVATGGTYNYYLGTGFDSNIYWPNSKGGWDYFNGTLDEAAVYNYALSGQQVLTHYRAGLDIPILAVSVTDSTGGTGYAFSGTNLTYTITVTNQNASTVSGAAIADTFPAGLTTSWMATTTGGATGFTASGTGNIGDTVTMPAGSTITYTVQAAIGSTATGPLADTVTADTNPSSATPILYTTSATDTVNLYALTGTEAYVNPSSIPSNYNQTTYGGTYGMAFDVNSNVPLEITQLGAFDSGTTGNFSTDPVTVQLYDRNNPNAGPLASVTFNSTTPGTQGSDGNAFQTLASPLILPAGFQGMITASGYGVGNPAGNWNISGNIGPTPWTTNNGGGLISFTGGSFYTNPSQANVFPTTPDGGPANAFAAGTFVFQPNVAVLSVTKTAATSVNAGSQLAYTVTVQNIGTAAAQGVSLADPLPAGTTFVSDSGATGWTTSESGNTITDTIPTFAAGASATFTWTVQVPANTAAGTTLTNTVTATGLAGTPVAGTLLAYWKFDDGSGTTAVDSSGNGNTGTLQGTPTPTWGTGKMLGDVVLPGDGGSINYGTAGNLNFAAGSDFTIAGWVNTTDNFGMILSQRDSTNGNSDIDIGVGFDGADNSAGHLVAVVRDDADSSQLAHVLGGLVNDGNWHYFSLVRSGATGTISLYLDGVLQGTDTNAGASGPITTDLRAMGEEEEWVNTGTFSADQQYLTGALDDVRIYNSALTASEIDTLANVTTADVTTATASATTTVNTQSKLTITKSGPADVSAGGTMTYTLIVKNGGPSDASGVSITDPLPQGVTYDAVLSTLPTGWTAGTATTGSIQTVTLTDANPLAANASSGNLVLGVDVSASLANGTTLGNIATAKDSDSPTPDTATSTKVITTVIGPTTISLAKSGSSTVYAGDAELYNLVVTDIGSNPAYQTVITDPLPAGTTYDAAKSTLPTGWTASIKTSGSIQTVTLTDSNTLAAGATSGNIILAVDVPSSTAAGTTLGNIATAVADNAPKVSSTNATPWVKTQSTLSLTKAATAGNIYAGNSLIYNLKLTNSGPSDASGVSIKDPLPQGFTYDAAKSTLNGWAASTSTSGGIQTVTLTDPNSLAAGTSSGNIALAVDITSTVANGTVVTNSATATDTDSPTPDTAKGTSGNVTVYNVSSLTISKSGPGSAVAGGNATFTITVTNNGSSAVTIGLTDPIPTDVTGVGWSVTGTSGTVTGLPGTSQTGAINLTTGSIHLGAGSSFTITETDTINPAAAGGGSFTNTATVTLNASSGFGPTPSPIAASATVNLTSQSNLSLNKTGPSTAAAGGTITYTLTLTNGGLSYAANATVTDPLPAGLTFVSAIAPIGWLVSAPAVGSGGTVTFTDTSFAPGSPVSFTISAQAPSSIFTLATYKNTATAGDSDMPTPDTTTSPTVTTTITPTPNAQYLDYVYQKLLNRAPDAGAVTYLNQLNSGVAASTVVLEIENTSEYQTDVLTAIYNHYLGHGLNSTAAPYLSQLAAGTSIEQVIAEIIATPEYYAAKGGTNTAFVTGVYEDVLGRPPTSAELSSALSSLTASQFRNGGGSTQATTLLRQNLALNLLTSTEYRTDIVGGGGPTWNAFYLPLTGYYPQFAAQPATATQLATGVQQLQQGISDQTVLASILGSAEGIAAATTAATIPAQPTLLSATPGVGQLTLNWSAVAGANTYNLYRGTSSGGETLVATGLTGTSFTDSGLTGGTTYYYEVTAVDSAGESTKSNELNAVPFGTWTAVPGFVSQVTAAYNSVSGAVELFGIGGDHGVWLSTETSPGGTFSTWTPLGGYVTQIVVGTNTGGLLTVFGIGGDHGAWFRQETSPGNFGAWTPLGGYVQQLAVGRNTNSGDLELFGIGGDNGVWVTTQGAATPTGFTAWSPLGGYVTQIAVGTNKDGDLQVFGIGGDHAAWFRQETSPGSFATWASLGGYVKQLAVAQDSTGDLELYAIGGDNAVWYAVQTANNATTFSNWSSLGGYVTQIAVGTNADGTLSVFGVGGNGAAWYRQQQAGGFSAWSSLGGSVEQLATANEQSKALTLFAVGSDNVPWYLRL